MRWSSHILSKFLLMCFCAVILFPIIIPSTQAALPLFTSLQTDQNIEAYSAQPLLTNPSILHDMGLNSFLNAGFNGNNITIAVIDTGIDIDHIALDHDGNISTTNDYAVKYAQSFIASDDGMKLSADDSVGHGTAIAGLIAGRTITAFGKTYGGVHSRSKFMEFTGNGR